jgi:hypothetical protein
MTLGSYPPQSTSLPRKLHKAHDRYRCEEVQAVRDISLSLSVICCARECEVWLSPRVVVVARVVPLAASISKLSKFWYRSCVARNCHFPVHLSHLTCGLVGALCIFPHCTCSRFTRRSPNHGPSLFNEVPGVIGNALYHGPDGLVVMVVHSGCVFRGDC